MRLKHMLHIAALLIILALCMTMASCDQAATKNEALTEPSSSAPASSAGENTDGHFDRDSGSAADYAGLYRLTEHEGDAPFTLAEIPEGNGECMYLYNSDEFVACSFIDYSEQRALNGNALMVISFAADDIADEDSISEIAIFPSSTEFYMRGYDALNDFTGTFEKVGGTMLLQSEDEASDYLLDVLEAAGYSLEGTAVITEDGGEDLELQGLECSRWFFAWGKNEPDKFTAEKRFAVTAIRQVWECDALTNEWMQLH